LAIWPLVTITSSFRGERVRAESTIGPSPGGVSAQVSYSLLTTSTGTAGDPGQFTSRADGCGSRGSLEGIDLSKNTTPSPEHQASQSKPSSEGAELAAANVPGADRPRVTTKRAMPIGMLERPEGASVAEIGQRLGLLPYTARAAITALRHAGRKVMRSEDADDRSVYRLAPPEIVGR